MKILRADHYALAGASDYFYTVHTLVRPFARFAEKDSTHPWDVTLFHCRNYTKFAHFLTRASDPLLDFVWKAKFGKRSSLYFTLSKDYSSALDLNSNSFTLKPSFFIASLAKLFFQHIEHIIVIILISFVSLFSYTSHVAGDRRRIEPIKFKEYVRLEQEEYDQKRYKLRYLREAIKAFEEQKRLERIRARGPSPIRYSTVVKKIRQKSKNLRGLLRYDIKENYKLDMIWMLRDTLRIERKLRRQLLKKKKKKQNKIKQSRQITIKKSPKKRKLKNKNKSKNNETRH